MTIIGLEEYEKEGLKKYIETVIFIDCIKNF
jgi:hypothetical protein